MYVLIKSAVSSAHCTVKGRKAKDQEREVREDKVFIAKWCHSLVIARQTAQVILRQELIMNLQGAHEAEHGQVKRVG